MAKGKDFSIIRDHKGNKFKEFEEIKFFQSNKELDIVIVNITAGNDHVIALDLDRNIWGWGSNKFKQISPYSEEKLFKYFVKIDYSKIDKKYMRDFIKTVIF